MDKAPKSEIPYVTDGTTKYWCMTVFQQNEEHDKAAAALSRPPELDLSRAIQPAKTENTAGALESAAMVGLTPRECISQHLSIVNSEQLYSYYVVIYYIYIIKRNRRR